MTRSRAEHDTERGPASRRGWAWCRVLAVPEALYVAGFLAIAAPTHVWSWPGLATVALAWGAFTLERAKLPRSLLDPADAEADPARHRLLEARGGMVRTLALTALIAAAAVLVAGGDGLQRLIPIGVVGVLLYGHRFATPVDAGRPSRLKDLPGLKNAAVAGAYVACVALLTGGIEPALAIWALLLVGADAILCDIPDAPTDRRHGTRSLPVMLGPNAARAIAGASHAGACVLALATDIPAALALAPATGIAMALLPRAPKWLVDARLAPVAAATALLTGS